MSVCEIRAVSAAVGPVASVPADLVPIANTNNQFITKNPPQKVNVEIGLSDDTNIEITFGLKEGDTVVVQTTNPNTAKSTTATPAASGIRIPGLTGGGRQGG